MRDRVGGDNECSLGFPFLFVGGDGGLEFFDSCCIGCVVHLLIFVPNSVPMLSLVGLEIVFLLQERKVSADEALPVLFRQFVDVLSTPQLEGPKVLGRVHKLQYLADCFKRVVRHVAKAVKAMDVGDGDSRAHLD